MYEKGLIELVDPLCDHMEDDEYCYTEVEGGEIHTHFVEDNRENITWSAPCAYLPHSCDNWVIGGHKEIKLMIEDLQEVLKKLEK